MKTVRNLLGRLLACGFIAVFSLGLFALDAWPVPTPLRHAEGRIISRTPIYSKGKLTGFRFCIDSPRLTFTYANPDPRVESMWVGVNNASRARIVYSDGLGTNPRLWGLSLDGYELASPDEVRSAHLRQSGFWLALCVAALAYGYYAWRQSSRRRS